jgi:hypothetical protein
MFISWIKKLKQNLLNHKEKNSLALLFLTFKDPNVEFEYENFIFSFTFEDFKPDRLEFQKNLLWIKEIKTGALVRKEVAQKLFSLCSEFLVSDIYFSLLILYTCYIIVKEKLENRFSEFSKTDLARSIWKIFIALRFKDPSDKNFLKIISQPHISNWIVENIVKDQQEELDRLKALQLFMNPELFSEVYGKPSREEIVKKVEEQLRKRISEIRK